MPLWQFCLRYLQTTYLRMSAVGKKVPSRNVCNITVWCVFPSCLKVSWKATQRLVASPICWMDGEELWVPKVNTDRLRQSTMTLTGWLWWASASVCWSASRAESSIMRLLASTPLSHLAEAGWPACRASSYKTSSSLLLWSARKLLGNGVLISC